VQRREKKRAAQPIAVLPFRNAITTGFIRPSLSARFATASRRFYWKRL
jgi:hypothetical protein